MKKGNDFMPVVIGKGVKLMRALPRFKLVVASMLGLCLVGGVLVLAEEGVRAQAKVGPATVPASQPAGESGLVPPDLGDLNTLYVRRVSYTSRKPDPVFEDFYDRTKGHIHWLTYRNGTIVVINDGQYEWRRKLGTPLVSRQKPIISPAQLFKSATRSVEGLLKQDPVRDPSGDRVIGNDLCRCYRVTYPNQSQPVFNWVDGANRLRRVRREPVKDDPFSGFETEYAYNPPIDPARFAATQPADAEVVDRDRYLEKVFPLDDVIFMTEVRGMVFAIHYVEQDTRGRFHLICSSRPTEARRPKLKPSYQPASQGDFMIWGGTPLTPSTFPNRGVVVAELMGVGFTTVEYCVLVPDFERQPIPDLCQFRVEFRSESTATTLPATARLEEKEGFPVEIEVPRAGNHTLEDFLGRAYDMAWRLGGVLTARVAGGSPVAITKEEYLKEAMDRVEGRGVLGQRK